MKHNKTISLFSVSFKQGFTSPNLPIATFYQGDKEINFILDSGSDNNLINSSCLDQFKHAMHEKNESTTFRLSGVGGTQETSMCTLSFGCEEESYTANFLVTNLKDTFDGLKREHGIPIHGILGAKFLVQHNIILDFNKLEAYNKK